MNVVDFLLETADARRVAIVDTGTTYTYGELHDDIQRSAGTLDRRGIGPHDLVGLLADSSAFWVVSYLSVMSLGATIVPFSPSLTPELLDDGFRCANCKAFLVQAKHHRKVTGLMKSTAIIMTDDELQNSSSPGIIARDVDEARDVAALMFTSGSAARPRAVMVSHRNLRANTESIIQCLGLTCNDRMMAVLPLHYCFGTSLLHTHLRVGASLVLAPGFAFPEKTLDLLASTKCTGFAGIPSMYENLLHNSTLTARSLPTLRSLQQAGGKMPNSVIEELVSKLPAQQLFVMYGQTEATARLSCLPPSLLKTKLGSIGKGIPGVRLTVEGDDGMPVSPGTVGEIIASGENITLGYWGNPQATADTFVNGNLRTGDMARVDQDGFITIVGRKSNFIKVSGNRVSAERVEETISGLPETEEVAVVGVEDQLQGEAIKAYVVKRKGSSLTPADVIAHCRKRLPTFMVPRFVEIVRALPHNEQGKVLKSVLKQRTQS